MKLFISHITTYNCVSCSDKPSYQVILYGFVKKTHAEQETTKIASPSLILTGLASFPCRFQRLGWAKYNVRG